MRRKALKRFALAATCAALLGIFPLAAPAAAAVQVITPYPAVAVQAGKSVTLNLEVITTVRQKVGLNVTEVPKGWQATLRGGGFVINGVFGSPKDKDNVPPQVQLEIKVPPDAAQANYRVVVRGTAAGGSDTLVLDVKVSETAAGVVTLTPEFPALRGSATETFRFSITLTNNSPEKTTFTLSAEGPEGWTVNARPTTETRAATVAVEGGATATVEVEADPPDQVVAGSYPLKVRAVGGDKSAEADISAEITGNISMTFTTENERLNTTARAGRKTEVVMVVRNTGTAPLNSVRLSATPPTGWEIEFDQETIEQVRPRGTARVTASIIPAAEAVAGDYAVDITALGEGQSEEVQIRVTVETSRLWGLVGILVIFAALGGLLWVFRRYGRR